MENEPWIILLVEDNPDHAELVRRCFVKCGLAGHIAHVSDGEAALDYLFRQVDAQGASAQQDAALPHLILLDLRLPKIDGLEVLREIKASEKLRSIPVVILTSSEAQSDLARAYSNHVNSYLVKPVGYDEFAQLMNDLSNYWLSRNRQPQP